MRKTKVRLSVISAAVHFFYSFAHAFASIILTAALHAQKELEHIVWMIDENLDGLVDWEEFTLMFERNIADDTPQSLACSVYP